MSKGRRTPKGAVPMVKDGHRTYHLVPVSVWGERGGNRLYTPELFEHEGFIHCTDSKEELIAVGNRYYQADSRDYCVLEIDCARVGAPIVYEDAGLLFPHIYGSLETDAVRAVLSVVRQADGTFLAVG